MKAEWKEREIYANVRAELRNDQLQLRKAKNERARQRRVIRPTQMQLEDEMRVAAPRQGYENLHRSDP